MTEEELKEIEKRADDATPGPWLTASYVDRRRSVAMFFDCSLVTREDPNLLARGSDMDNAWFIKHAREDVPALIAEVRRLKANLALTNAAIEAQGAQYPHLE